MMGAAAQLNFLAGRQLCEYKLGIFLTNFAELTRN